MTDVDNLKSNIEENSSLKSAITTKSSGKRNPSPILYNIPTSLGEEVVQESLKSHLHLANPLNLRFKFKGASPNTSNWVFEAPAPVLRTLNK
ncbi:hypothetical protein AVEN_134478-1, partial [Araneus ventricosus]